MAERRMFSKSIVLSDAFLDMPLSARCLYFTLGMLADDDGFVGNPKSIMRQCGASQDDMLVLLQKRYLLGFDSGVIVIKHWRMNNYLRNDRYHTTTYLEEKDELTIDERGAYTEKVKNDDLGIPCGNQVVDKRYTEDRIGKDSIGKDSIVYPPISPTGDGETKPKKETQIQLFRRLRNDYNLSYPLQETIEEWLKYKTEMKKTYKETGLKQLLNKFVEAEQSYGSQKVIEVVNDTMANGYQGIIWDWLTKSNKPKENKQQRDLFAELRDC